MYDIIEKIYRLIDLRIEFFIKDGKLAAKIPESINETDKVSAKEFIQNNRDQIFEIINNNPNYYRILSTNIYNKLLPCSYYQEGIGFIENLGSGSSYNMNVVYEISDDIKIDLFENAFNLVLKNNEILRTNFVKNEEFGIGQIIKEDNYNKISFETLRIDNEDSLYEEINKEVNKNFNLEKSLPIRAKYFKVKDKNYLCITIHHIAFDAFSIHLLNKQLEYYYKSQNETLEHNEHVVQYKDFAIWQKAKALTDNEKFWSNYLKDYKQVSFKIDKVRPKKFDYSGLDVTIDLSEEETSTLLDFCKKKEFKLPSMFLTAYLLLFKTFANEDDLITGVAFDGRDLPELENMIGNFVNVLPFRFKIDDKFSLREFISQVDSKLKDIQRHKDIPLSKIIEITNTDYDLSQNPIFQTFFSFQSLNTSDQFMMKEIRLKSDVLKKAKFDLSISVNILDNRTASINFNFAKSLFNTETIEYFAEIYKSILFQFKINIDKEMRSIAFCNNESLNNQNISPANKKLIHSIFEDQVLKTPDNIALVYENSKLTYSELNKKANSLAYYLNKKLNLSTEDLVCLYLDRSEYLIITILAVLKSKAAYVPLSLDFPKDRINFILNDTNSKVVLSTKKLSIKLRKLQIQADVIEVDDILERELELNLDDSNPSSYPEDDNLAYVIYTSGTTATPKGVMLGHSNVVNIIFALQNIYDLRLYKKVSAYTNYSFDVSVSEFFSPLLNGGELHLLNEEVRSDLEKISKYIIENSINYIYLPPSLLSYLPKDKYESLVAIIYAGEPCSKATAKYWAENYKLYNYYGPTETAIYATGTQISKDNVESIGYPIDNTYCYVLDKNLNILPENAPGELYISGLGVSRGYLNNPSLTAERFITNPYDHLSRLYKTGDIVVKKLDGSINYIGREDNQIKIRGYRVELGEIEYTVSDIDGVIASLCIIKNHNNQKYLCLYYISSPNAQVTISEVRSYLRKKLPHYMLPAAIIKIDEFPINNSGKIDVSCLPNHDFEIAKSNIAETEEEKKICELFREVLSYESEIGLDNSFFGIGGTSILAMILVSKLNREFGISIDLAAIFENPTARELLGFIKSSSENHVITKSNISDKKPLSSAQEGMWFYEKLNGSSSLFNITSTYRLLKNISFDILLNVIKEVLKRHEILRSVVNEDVNGNAYLQVKNVEDCGLDLNVIHLSSLEFNSVLLQNLNYSFDLNSLIPIKFVFYLVDNNQPFVSIIVHHIAFDAWSLDILLNEISHFYSQLSANNQDEKLNDLEIQYSDYAIWKKNQFDTYEYKQKISYWENKLKDLVNTTIAYDNTRISNKISAAKILEFRLNNEISEKLKQVAKLNNTTLFSILMSAFALCVKCFTGQKDIIIGTISSNRDKKEIENLIGMFVNPLALRFNIDETISLNEYIKSVSREILESLSNKTVPFDKVVQHMNLTRVAAVHPVFQIVFEMDESLERNLSQNLFEDYSTKNLISSNARFDLRVNVHDKDNGISIAFEYPEEIYKHQTIKSLGDSFRVVLEQISENSNIPLYQVGFISSHMMNELINDINNTSVKFNTASNSVSELITNISNKTPSAIAIVYDGKEYSYSFLEEFSSRLANYLSDLGVGKNSVVAVILERSYNAIASMIAILKAGGTFLPVDPCTPTERIDKIIEDSASALIICDDNSQDKLPSTYAQIINLDNDLTHIEKLDKNLVNPIQGSEEDIAYIIYTSGSTGDPKGVMIENHSFLNALLSCVNRREILTDSKVLQTAIFSFDSSILEIFPSLIKGATIYIANNDIRNDPLRLLKYCAETQINNLFLTTKLAQEFLNYGDNLSSLKTLTIAGEQLVLKSRHNKKYKIINEYGPTENSVCTTSYIINEDDVGVIPIGRPIDNCQVFVLDEYKRIMPIGAPGELYIGGEGLAKGYLNDLQKTSEKFVNINHHISEQRLYKSGDIVRWIPGNLLQYIRRNDNQIKIRGHRVELQEVQLAIIAYKSIDDVVVSVKNLEGDLKQLIAFYTSQDEINQKELFKFLKLKLPDYMIPSSFYKIDKIPLNNNGKVDFKKLLSFIYNRVKNAVIQPSTDTEFKIRKIFANLSNIREDEISITSDLFTIGLDSILAIKLASRINSEFNKEISLADIFHKNTIETLSNLLDSINYTDTEVISTEVENPEQQLLSFAQERIWFIEKLDDDISYWNVPLIFKLDNSVDIKLLEKAIFKLIQRHEVLRTIIKESENGTPYQLILGFDEIQKSIDIVKLLSLEFLDSALRKESFRKFDLSREIPIKITIYEVLNEFYISIIINHISFDGWSFDIFINELSSIYECLKNNIETLNLPDLNIQYKDYAIIQRSRLCGEIYEKQSKYWKEKLSSAEILNLITDKIRPSEFDFKGSDYKFEIDKKLSSGLRARAVSLCISLYSLMLSAFVLMLRCYSRQNDIVIGALSAGRNYKNTNDLIGVFINSLPLRIKIDHKNTIEDYIKIVSKEVLDSQEMQDLPFEMMLSELDIPKDLSRHPIFDVVFALQKFGGNIKSSIFKTYKSNKDIYGVAKLDLSVFIDDSEETLKGVVNFATSIYEKSTIKNFIKLYINILEEFVNSYEKRIYEIQNLSISDYQEMVYNWNDSFTNFDFNYTFYDRFKHNVSQYPDKIAVICGDEKLTYKELNERCNGLSRIFKSQVNNISHIVLIFDRDIDFLASIIAIFKIGCIYLPIDPATPHERINAILNEAKSSLVVTNRHNRNIFENQNFNLLLIDEVNHDNLDKSDFNNLVYSDQIAYTIFTSGSTGTPKGAMLTQKGMLNHMLCKIEDLKITQDDKIAQNATQNFDVSVWQFLTALAVGGTTVIFKDYAAWEPKELLKIVQKDSVTVFQTVPTHLDVILSEIEDDYKLSTMLDSISCFIVNGEPLKREMCKRWFKIYPSKLLVNAYGPTECSDDVTHFKFRDLSAFNTRVVPISGTLPNQKLYILDDYLNPLPYGAPGELYIGGDGIGLGYINRPDLTAEKFIASPFSNDNIPARLYKTGDLVRYLEGGEIEFLGRIDFQVKIRGCRVELEEIEHKLFTYEGITSALVIAKDGNNNIDTKIIAYYASDTAIEEQELIDYLEKFLPKYMIPNFFIHLEKLPLALNGKIDRKKLPEPTWQKNNNFEDCKTDIEFELRKLYAEVLSIKENEISSTIDFFKLGGNSIMATRLLAKIKKFFGINLKLVSIFRHSSIRQLANFIENKNDTEVKSQIEKTDSNNIELLSFAQERMWFINKYDEGGDLYNVPILYRLSENVSLKILNEALNQLIEKQEALRTIIYEEDGTAYQKVLKSRRYIDIEVINSSVLGLREDISEFCRYNFGLKAEIPINAKIFATDFKYLCVVVHHIAFDGWSIDIFIKELTELYKNIASGKTDDNKIHQLNYQYKDFAVWQRKYYETDICQKQINFWKSYLSGVQTLNLYMDDVRKNRKSFKGKNLKFELSLETSENFRKLAKNLGISLFSILLGSFVLFLRAYSNQRDIVLGIPVFNRHYDNTQGIIGLFVNSVVFRKNIKSSQKILDYLRECFDEMVEIQHNQDIPFEKIVEALSVSKDVNIHPIFQVMFGIQNFGSSANELMESSNEILDEIIESARFDLSAYIDDSADILTGVFNYSTELFKEDTIRDFKNSYIFILDQISELASGDIIQGSRLDLNNGIKSDKLISDINCIQRIKIEAISKQDNDSYLDFGLDYHDTVHKLIEKQTIKTPNNIAIISGNNRLSYNELNSKANQLARYLEKISTNRETIITLIMDRGIDFLASMLAVFKSGNAYLPIDPSIPEARVESILIESKTEIILLSKKYSNLINIFRDIKAKFIIIEDIDLDLEDSSNLDLEIEPSSLSYVIYTSGSTGKPKGAMVEHKGMLNHLLTKIYDMNINENDIVAQTATQSFDVSVWQFLSALVVGGSTVVFEGDNSWDPEPLAKIIEHEKVTIFQTVPSHMRVILSTLEENPSLLNSFSSLKYLIINGEALSYSICYNVFNLYPNIPIINAYGPTECSDDVTHYKLYEAIDSEDIVPISGTLPNNKLYVLDDDFNILPNGVAGELYIGGAGVGRGYLGRADLTAEKFIANPFFENKPNDSQRLYKTGDLVIKHSDGTINFLGRIDHQIKIRGFRVELNEIEKVIKNIEGVKEAVVVTNGNFSNPYLSAYFTAQNNISSSKVIGYLETILPEYMVPQRVKQLDKMPLTLSGKIDKNSLPEIELNISEEIINPRDNIESDILEIWKEVLNISSNIGVRQNFFKLGGQSILAIKLLSRINAKYSGITLKVSSIFLYPTIEQFAIHVKSLQESNKATKTKKVSF